MFVNFNKSSHKLSPKKHKGFTLAELLIALAILGVVGSFSVSKVLQTSADSQKRALFKESISMVQTSLTLSIQSSQLSSTTNTTGQVYNALANYLNYSKTCAGTCVANPTGDWKLNYSGSGFQFSNGAAAQLSASTSDTTSWGNVWITIDYNGNDGPNSFGEDQFTGYLCVNNPNGICNARSGINVPRGTLIGRLLPLNDAPTLALWRNIWGY